MYISIYNIILHYLGDDLMVWHFHIISNLRRLYIWYHNTTHVHIMCIYILHLRHIIMYWVLCIISCTFYIDPITVNHHSINPHEFPNSVIKTSWFCCGKRPPPPPSCSRPREGSERLGNRCRPGTDKPVIDGIYWESNHQNIGIQLPRIGM